MEENTLPNDEIQRLRASGVLTEQEIAVSQGDLLIAVDVVTQNRRILSRESMSEGIGKKRLLKG